MYLERESYVQEYQHQEKLIGIESRWQIEELMRAQQGMSLWHKLKLWLHGFGRQQQTKTEPALPGKCVDCAVS